MKNNYNLTQITWALLRKALKETMQTRKKILLIIILLFSFRSKSQIINNTIRTKFINTITEKLEANDFMIKFKVNFSNGETLNAFCTVEELYLKCKVRYKLTERELQKKIRKNIIYNIPFDFKEIKMPEDPYYIIDNARQQQIDSITKTNKNFIDEFYINKMYKNDKYFYYFNEILNRLFDMNITEYNIQGIKHLLGYYQNKIVNKGIIDSIQEKELQNIASNKQAESSPVCFYLEKVLVSFCNPPQSEPWSQTFTHNDTLFSFDWNRTNKNYKGTIKFTLSWKNKNDNLSHFKILLSGEFCENGAVFRGGDVMNRNGTFAYTPSYYKPDPCGTWTYYNASHEIIKKEEYSKKQSSK